MQFIQRASISHAKQPRPFYSENPTKVKGPLIIGAKHCQTGHVAQNVRPKRPPKMFAPTQTSAFAAKNKPIKCDPHARRQSLLQIGMPMFMTLMC